MKFVLLLFGFLLSASSALAQVGSATVMANTNNGVVTKPTSFWSGNRSNIINVLDLDISINGGSPNGSGALVHWSQVFGIPAGIADGSDDGGGMTNLVLSTSLSGLSIGGSPINGASGTLSISGILGLASGGTGGTNAAQARAALGLLSAALSDSSAFAAASHAHSATDITSGSLADARLSANVALRAGGNTWTGTQVFIDPVTFLELSISNMFVEVLQVPFFAFSNNWATATNEVPTKKAVYDQLITRAPIDSPTFTGSPQAPHQAVGATPTNLVATVGHVSAVQEATLAAANPDLVTAQTITNGAAGNRFTVNAKGKITGVVPFDFRNDYHDIEEFVGPTGYKLFFSTANGGASGAGTTAITPTGIFGMWYLSTTGVNQYPQTVMSTPFKPSGMTRVSLRCRFQLPILSDASNPFELQVGFMALGTYTNRPTYGSFIATDSNLGNANVHLFNANNSNYSYVDTGVPLTAATWEDWTIELTPTASIAYRGETPMATNTTQHPGSNFTAAWGGRMARYNHTAAAVRFVYWDRFEPLAIMGR